MGRVRPECGERGHRAGLLLRRHLAVQQLDREVLELPCRESLALGTGDVDFVYHAALPELREALSAIGNEDQLDMLNTIVQGRRLRDISDLVLDLLI